MATHAPRWSEAGSRAALLLISLLPAWLLACRPDLAPPSGSDRPPEGAPSPAALTVTIDPPAPAMAAPAALRLRIGSPGRGVDPERIALVRGAVAPAQLRQIQRREISAALEKRMVPVQIWWDEPEGMAPRNEQDGGADAPVLIVAPESLLMRGEAYALAIAQPATVFDFHVDEDDPAPLLRRIWPPE